MKQQNKKLRVQFLGDNIRKFRADLSLTREDLVARIYKIYKIKITVRSIINWENGKTSPAGYNIAILAQALNQPVTYFFSPVIYHREKL